jgi:hypothetical protein
MTKKIKPGDIFIPHLDDGQKIPGREQVIIEEHPDGNYYARGIFRDDKGNPSFRPLAGGTASLINIGEITGYVSKKELKRLQADLEKERRGRIESE